jgi:hypothetical protein
VTDNPANATALDSALKDAATLLKKAFMTRAIAKTNSRKVLSFSGE